MAINFIPNDPLANGTAPAMRQKTPRPDRPSNQAGFTVNPDLPAQALYEPGAVEFAAWQSREAALAALDAWASVNGAPLSKWPRATPNRRRLDLNFDAGEDLNAYYDGQSLSFFHSDFPSDTVFSGSSTDVVAHEAGHGLLDSIRPQLFSVNFTEAGAFHEAFGDIHAIVTALHDKETREDLLAATADLSENNFVETTAEELSDAIRRAFGASHPAAKPRQALNTFQWQLPSTLPSSAPPDDLSSEVHSFARVFSGCFYDCLRNIFLAQTSQSEATLLKTAVTAEKLLIAGARSAPLTPRFFRAVGRAMVLADNSANGGANRPHIESAFNAHGILLGAAALLSPLSALAGKAPSLTAKAAAMAATTKKDLLERLQAPKGAKLLVDALHVGAEKVAQAVHERLVDLGDVNKSLKGVVAVGHEAAMVGESAGRAALLSTLPDVTSIGDEVKSFVEALLKNGNLKLAAKARAAVTKKGGLPTHEIKKVGKQKVLTRVRFAC